MTYGLFDGFEGYKSVTDNDLREAVSSWLVVLDTNVLLHLYNYQGQSLDDFMRVFEALGDRLFVPHQVLDEFWRNRTTVLRENKGRHLERESIEKAFDSIATDLRKWYQRSVSRRGAIPEDVTTELKEAREAVLRCIDDQAEQRSVTADTPTQDDGVVNRLGSLLAGRVGPPPTTEERDRLVQVGRQRIQRRIPPGYMDGEKNPDRAVGDFLVWHQVMQEAGARGMSVLLVTQDTKEDWWADRGTATMRARPELVEELFRISGQRLVMARTHDLLKMGSIMGVDVNDATLAEAMEDQGAPGWTDELYRTYLDYLEAWPAHSQAFLKALEDRGRIARAELAQILGKDVRASMKGTSKPYATALRHMCADYDLDEADFEVPFVAHYTGRWMDCFVVPDPHYEAILGAVAKFADMTDEDADPTDDSLAMG